MKIIPRIGLLLMCSLALGTVNAQEPEPPVRSVAIPPPPVLTNSKREVENDIVDFPEVDAEFPGGPEAMKEFIQRNVDYPEVSARKGDQGRVYVTFVVERDGSISGIEVMRGVTEELNEEAIRLVSEMPLWKAAEVDGEKVRARCRLPITFVLVSDPEEEAPKRRLFRRY